MYEEKIKDASALKKYSRNTYLDYPECDQRHCNDIIDEESKLSREEQIDDQLINMQFVAGAQEAFNQQQKMLNMSVDGDVTRLCEMYQSALTKLKLSLPSDNVENRQYKKLEKQYKGRMVDGKPTMIQTDQRESLYSKDRLS